MKAARFEMEIGMGSCGSALNIDNENNMIILQVKFIPPRNVSVTVHVSPFLKDSSESQDFRFVICVSKNYVKINHKAWWECVLMKYQANIINSCDTSPFDINNTVFYHGDVGLNFLGLV